MKTSTQKTTRLMIQAALIAAIYVALTYALSPISYGMLQVRVSEVLTILPIFTPAGVPGLFIGCLLANLISAFGVLDIIFGSLATLIAALLTYVLRKNKYLAMLPPVLVNAFMVGTVIFYQASDVKSLGAWAATCGFVGLGQLISCYGLGLLAIYMLQKHQDKIFR